MAEEASDLSGRTNVHGKFECGFCHKRLRDPKLLQCLHNFCEKCLVDQVPRNSRAITCPLCSQKTTASSNGFQSLKTNFHLIGQLEDALVKEELLSEEFGQPICYLCDLEKKAESRCLDCSMYLCPRCKTTHQRIAVLSKHTIVSLDELRLGEVTKTFRRQKKAEECPSDHRFYCETCDDVICKDCPEIDPRSGQKISPGWGGASKHKTINLESAASSKRKMTKQMITNVQKALGDYKSTLKSIAADREKLEDQSRELKEQVKVTVREITKKVEEEEARLLKEIADIQKEKENTLHKSKKNLKATMQHMSDSLQMAIDVTDSASDQDFLGLVSLIQNNLEDLISKRPDRIYTGLPQWEFIRESSGCIGSLNDPSGRSYLGYGQHGTCASSCYPQKSYCQGSSTIITRKCSPLKRVPVQPRLPSKYLQKPATVSATSTSSKTSPPEAPKFTFTEPTQLSFSFGQTTTHDKKSCAATFSAKVFSAEFCQPPSMRKSQTKQSPVTPGTKQSPVIPGTKQSPVTPGTKRSPVIPGTKQSPVIPGVTASTSSQSPFAGFDFGQQIKTPGKPSQQVLASKKEEDDDVNFISEKLPTADQRARAQRLLLPPTFFLYEDDPPCPGCRGCEEEDLAQRGVQLSKRQHQLATGLSAVVTPAAVTPASVFGSAASSQATFGSVAGDTKSTFGDSIQGAPSIFGLSFASLSSGKQGTFAGKETKGFAFAKAGAQVFGSGSIDTAGGDKEHDPHYDPIVPLLELVDTKTGEEDEEIMYKQRARLYRYAKELNLWKERGIGEVKLMRHKDSGGLRLLMRRERVLKLCANHRITDDIKLETMKSSDRTLVWHALDYSEDEPCHEQFAIKFKTPELAVEFKLRFEELQAERKRELEAEKEDEAVVLEGPRGDQPEKDGDKKDEDKKDGDKKDGKDDMAAEATVPDTEPTPEEIIAKYQPKPGSWQCDDCWLSNEESALTCISCTASKPGAVTPSATQQLSTLSKLAGASQQNQSVTSSGSGITLSAGGGFSFAGIQTSDNASKPSGVGSFGQPSTFSKSPTDSGLLAGGPMKFGLSSSDTKMMAPKEKPFATPTSKFSFGSGFQKYDLGAAGDQSQQPVVTSTSPSNGFTFGATSLIPPKSDPVTAASIKSETQPLTPVKPDQPKEVLPAKVGTGFVFGAGSHLSQTPKSSAAPTFSKPSEEKPKGFCFADMAKTEGSVFSFRMDVSKTSKEAPEKSPVKPKSSGIVKSPQPQSPGLNKSDDGDYYKDDDGDHIHSDPIVELPECIEARTGEEGEEVRFSHRAKLFRYNKEFSQWKDRGIGDIKVLFNPDNNKSRIVMRREQVLKVCANHFVTPDLKLQPNAGSTKSWVWMAMDASEDEVQMEQLAVRFRTEELAQLFKEAVEAAQEDMKTEGVGDAVKIKDEAEKEHEKEAEEAEKEKKDVQGDVKEDDGEADEEDGEDEEENDGEEYKDLDNDDNDDDGDDNDGDGDGSDDDEEDEGGNSDGQGEDKQDATAQGDEQGGYSEQSPSVQSCDPNISQEFTNLLRNANANHAKKQNDVTFVAGSSKDDSLSEERDDIHFDPIVQLSEQLEKITGEEDENQLFCSRAKLYRFDKISSQWKDRGIGDIKILQNVKTRRYRILMRRDQVFRVCANHYITKDMALHPNAGSENSLVWQAMDASDGDPQPEQLAVRFKLAGTTQRFKLIFEECQAELRKLAGDNNGTEQA